MEARVLLCYKDMKFIVCPYCYKPHAHKREDTEGDAPCLGGPYTIGKEFEYGAAIRALISRDKVNARNCAKARGEKTNHQVGRPKGTKEPVPRRPKRDLKAEEAKEAKEEVSFTLTF